MDNTTKSILQMARGAITERADYEMARIIGNIMDANTKATAKRKLVLTLELVPDDERRNISVSVTVKSTLAATNPVTTSLYIAGSDAERGVQAVECLPQVPGQFDMDGGEAETPATLKIVNFA